MKLTSLLSDSRLPIHLPAAFFRRRKLSAEIRNVSAADAEVKLLLTFDVEYDLGSRSENKESRSVASFFDGITPLLDGRKATFFVQGDLAEKYGERLRALQKNHEIGLHGYAHEPWGSDWFVERKTPSVEERRELLRKALSEFEEAGLRQPRSFRAPDMVIDHDSLKLLEAAGFTHDSSFPSYRGIMPAAEKIGGLVEAPVSANPIPEVSWIPPKIRYAVFNMHTLAAFGEDMLLEYVDTILRIQKSRGIDYMLVFLAHPWEFTENSELNYCSEKNLGLLSDRLRTLEEKYRITYMRMEDACV